MSENFTEYNSTEPTFAPTPSPTTNSTDSSDSNADDTSILGVIIALGTVIFCAFICAAGYAYYNYFAPDTEPLTLTTENLKATQNMPGITTPDANDGWSDI